MKDWLSLLLGTVSMLIIIMVMLAGIVYVVNKTFYVVDKTCEGTYEYVDTNGAQGTAVNCYVSDIMYCRHNDGTRVKVVEYTKK